MNDLAASARKKLEEQSTPFTVAAFRMALRNHRDLESFHLLLQAGILSKAKTPQELIAQCFKTGSVEMASTLMSELGSMPISGKAFFELVARASFEEWDANSSKDFWRKLVAELLPRAEDIDFCKPYRARCDGKSIEEVFTPLLHAVYMQDADLVVQLVARGANVNRSYADDKLKGGNLMHLLCAGLRPNPGMIACLLQAGVDLSHKDEKGYTPLCIAVRNQSWQSVASSPGAAPVPDTEARDQLLLLVKQLLEHGADINAPTGKESDGSILIESIIRENFEIADYLIDAGADIHVRTRYGWTAGRLAFARKQKALGEKLIAKGAQLRPYVGLGANPHESGLLVTQLDNTTSGSAQLAGIRAGDVVESVNDIPVRSIEELRAVLAKFRPLDQIPFSVRRDGQTRVIPVELQAV